MSMSSMRISATGLTAQRLRLDTVASNIANAETTRTAAGGPYRRLQVVLQQAQDPSGDVTIKPAGVEVAAVAADPEPPRMVHMPGHPDADANGYVAMPNVQVVDEMVDLISATRAYEANVTAMNAAKTMITRALEIGRG